MDPEYRSIEETLNIDDYAEQFKSIYLINRLAYMKDKSRIINDHLELITPTIRFIAHNPESERCGIYHLGLIKDLSFPKAVIFFTPDAHVFAYALMGMKKFKMEDEVRNDRHSFSEQLFWMNDSWENFPFRVYDENKKKIIEGHVEHGYDPDKNGYQKVHIEGTNQKTVDDIDSSDDLGVVIIEYVLHDLKENTQFFNIRRYDSKNNKKTGNMILKK